jgi:hypothetical protein
MPTRASSLGKTGDLVLYSLPKTIGVPDGAVLELRTAQLQRLSLISGRGVGHAMYVAVQLTVLLLDTLAGAAPGSAIFHWLSVTTSRVFRPYRLLMAVFRNPAPMSAVSRFLLRRVPWEAIVRRRREIERRYDEGLDRAAFVRFIDTSTDSAHCAMGFAVLVQRRDSLVRHLRHYGIRGVTFVRKWDYFPFDDPLHADARTTMQQHFLFPTAPRLTDAEIDLVIQVANEWALTAATDMAV